MAKKTFWSGVALFLVSEGGSFVYSHISSPLLQILFFMLFLLCLNALFREIILSLKNKA